MPGLGTMINVAAIVLGGVAGLLFGKLLNENCQNTLTAACGISVLFIGISGALEGLMTVEGATLTSGRAMFVVACLALGGLVGEILDLEGKLERFGQWLKVTSGSAKDKSFVEGFVTASLTVCIGAMAIIGAIEDGINGNYSILATKAVLDLVIIMVMSCSLGKGCLFSAIPVGIFQGTVTSLARLAKPLMTEAALENLSLIGSILIFCVGLNLVWGKKVRVANLLPAVALAVALAFLPLGL